MPRPDFSGRGIPHTARKTEIFTMQQRSLFTEGLVSDALKNEGRLDSPLTFSTILADPPWDTLQRSGRGAHRHYPLMTVEAIAALPVGDLVSTDAHLWLWVTNKTIVTSRRSSTPLLSAAHRGHTWSYSLGGNSRAGMCGGTR